MISGRLLPMKGKNCRNPDHTADGRSDFHILRYTVYKTQRISDFVRVSIASIRSRKSCMHVLLPASLDPLSTVLNSQKPPYTPCRWLCTPTLSKSASSNSRLLVLIRLYRNSPERTTLAPSSSCISSGYGSWFSTVIELKLQKMPDKNIGVPVY